MTTIHEITATNSKNKLNDNTTKNENKVEVSAINISNKKKKPFLNHSIIELR
jgi:hypothetical protein